MIFSSEQRHNNAVSKFSAPAFPFAKSALTTSARAHTPAFVCRHTFTRSELIAYMHVYVHTHAAIPHISLTRLTAVCVWNCCVDERQEAGSFTAAWALQAQQFTQQ